MKSLTLIALMVATQLTPYLAVAGLEAVEELEAHWLAYSYCHYNAKTIQQGAVTVTFQVALNCELSDDPAEVKTLANFIDTEIASLDQKLTTKMSKAEKSYVNAVLSELQRNKKLTQAKLQSFENSNATEQTLLRVVSELRSKNSTNCLLSDEAFACEALETDEAELARLRWSKEIKAILTGSSYQVQLSNDLMKMHRPWLTAMVETLDKDLNRRVQAFEVRVKQSKQRYKEAGIRLQLMFSSDPSRRAENGFLMSLVEGVDEQSLKTFVASGSKDLHFYLVTPGAKPVTPLCVRSRVSYVPSSIQGGVPFEEAKACLDKIISTP